MTENGDLEKRMREVEEFISEVKGGRKLFLWISSAVGALAALLAAFWEPLFGRAGP